MQMKLAVMRRRESATRRTTFLFFLSLREKRLVAVLSKDAIRSKSLELNRLYGI